MNIALCDDNELFLKKAENKLKDLLDLYNIDYKIYLYISGNTLIDDIKSLNFDIVFLDIDMPGINGKDVADRLRKMSRNRFKLVFISDYYDEVFFTFKYDIESFIPKNRLNEFLPDELKRIIEEIRTSERQSFCFKYSNKNRILNGKAFLDEILFIESLNGEIVLHTVSANYSLVNYKFEKIKDQFKKYNFIDIHRTCFINIAYLSSIEKDSVLLRNGLSLPLSRRKRNSVNNAFFQYVKEKVIK